MCRSILSEAAAFSLRSRRMRLGTSRTGALTALHLRWVQVQVSTAFRLQKRPELRSGCLRSNSH
jgi:hypothetical protein